MTDESVTPRPTLRCSVVHRAQRPSTPAAGDISAAAARPGSRGSGALSSVQQPQPATGSPALHGMGHGGRTHRRNPSSTRPAVAQRRPAPALTAGMRCFRAARLVRPRSRDRGVHRDHVTGRRIEAERDSRRHHRLDVMERHGAPRVDTVYGRRDLVGAVEPCAVQRWGDPVGWLWLPARRRAPEPDCLAGWLAARDVAGRGRARAAVPRLNDPNIVCRPGVQGFIRVIGRPHLRAGERAGAVFSREHRYPWP